MTGQLPGIVIEAMPGALAACAAACNYPRVVLGQLVIEGQAGWADAMRRAVDVERWRLLFQLEPYVMRSTPGARVRLAAGPSSSDAELVVIGDAVGLRLVREALAFAPPAVRRIATQDAAWLFVGRQSVAWTASARFTGRDGLVKPRVVVCGPDATPKTILHEAAHLLLRPIDNPVSQAVTVDAEANLARLAREDPTWQESAVEFEATSAREDRVCDGLAFTWLSRLSPREAVVMRLRAATAEDVARVVRMRALS